MYMQIQKNDNLSVSSSLIQANMPLADKNWFCTGGSARFFAGPKTAQEFAQALIFAHENKQPIFILGHGANILISDAGFDGLVIHPQLNEISYTTKNVTTLITSGAGVSMSDLIEYCLNNNIIGLEEF